ncbi:MAG: cell division protein FtsA [Dehalococcoidia bacterium]
MSKDPVVAIDVGTSKVCCVMGNMDDGTVQIRGFGQNPSNGMHKGLVVNIDEAKEAIRQSVKAAEHSSGLPVRSVVVGITGRHVHSFNTKGTVSTTRSDRLVTPSDLERAMESAGSIEVPPDSQILHTIPQRYALDGQTKIKTPTGMHGMKVDVDTHIVTAAVASVQNLLKCVEGAGTKVADIILEPFASSEAVLTPDEREAGVVLADIGAGTTDITVFREGSIIHSAAIPVAGYQITRDIAIGLGIPFEVAEEVKKKYGRVIMDDSDMERAEEEINVAPGQNILFKDLVEIIRARVEETLRLVLLELPRFNYKSIVPAGFVLTGGSSNLLGIDALGRDIFKLSARVGQPRKCFGIGDDMLTNPAYATALGLLLWAEHHKEGEGMPKKGVFSGFGKALKGFWFRFKKLFR